MPFFAGRGVKNCQKHPYVINEWPQSSDSVTTAENTRTFIKIFCEPVNFPCVQGTEFILFLRCNCLEQEKSAHAPEH